MDDYQESMLRHLEWLGRIIFKDDQADFNDPARRFSYSDIPGVKDHPSAIHHWQLGMAMIQGAKLVRGLTELMDVMGEFADTAPLPIEAELDAVMRGRF